MHSNTLLKITEFRHELHRHPELSLQETGTLRRIRQFLADNTSLIVEERDGWLYAVKEGTDRDAGSIAFRADMDALPINESESDLPYSSVNDGISHKCGHDGHCAALCALAMELDAVETIKTVYLIFQGAEEIGEGAKKAVSLIREKGISEVYAFHNLSGYPEGEIVYKRGLTQPASEGLTISFQGKCAHAAEPEEGKNPAELIAGTVLHIREITGKAHDGMVLCTIVGMEAGNGDFGISAGEGRLLCTLRAENECEMKALEKEIISYAENESKPAGIGISVQITDYFPETRNTDAGIRRLLDAADQLQIPAMEMKSMWRASEDFGYYLKECGGAMFYIGNGEDWPALHSKEYDFNDRILEMAADLFRTIAFPENGKGERETKNRRSERD